MRKVAVGANKKTGKPKPPRKSHFLQPPPLQGFLGVAGFLVLQAITIKFKNRMQGKQYNVRSQ